MSYTYLAYEIIMFVFPFFVDLLPYFSIGDGAMEFFTNRIKITSKWTIPNLECHVGGQTDHANFAGTM